MKTGRSEKSFSVHTPETHCDAPRHFIPDGQTIDQALLEVLVGPAAVVDFSWCKPQQEVGVQDFEELTDQEPERVIMRFDWSDYWGRMQFYADHPYISQDAAHWLVDRDVHLLGMDTPTPDSPAHGRNSDLDSPNHKTLLEHETILVEYMCNLKLLSRRNVELVVLPLKINEGDGAPARCIAIEE